jgi:hypothetical protein
LTSSQKHPVRFFFWGKIRYVPKRFFASFHHPA